MRRRDLPKWVYGVLLFGVLAILFNLALAIYGFWYGQILSGAGSLLGVVGLSYLCALILYELERKRVFVIFGYALAAVSVTSLVAVWISLR